MVKNNMTDVMGRKVWDKSKYQDTPEKPEKVNKDKNGKPRKMGPPAHERTFLTQREEVLELEREVGKQKTINMAAPNAVKEGGFWCETCECVLKDSSAYMDHINGKKHNRLLGMTMRVKKATKSEVLSRLAAAKDKQLQLQQQQKQKL